MRKAVDKLKPIMIFEDEMDIMRDLKRLDTQILPFSSSVQHAFENLKIGDLSNEYLNDILFNSSKKITIEFITKVRSAIESEYLVDEAVSKASAAVEKLKNATNTLLNKCEAFSCMELLHYLSISENSNIIFSAESKEELKESHRQYVSSKEGIAKRLLHEKAVKALTDFKTAMGDSNLDVLEMFDYSGDDNIFPVPMLYE